MYDYSTSTGEETYKRRERRPPSPLSNKRLPDAAIFASGNPATTAKGTVGEEAEREEEERRPPPVLSGDIELLATGVGLDEG